jgi:hypothetical protein
MRIYRPEEVEIERKKKQLKIMKGGVNEGSS